MRLKMLLVGGLLLLSGCTSSTANQGWAGFVINQDKTSSSGQVPGKSYQIAPARLAAPSGALTFEVGEGQGDRLELQITAPSTKGQELLGKTLVVPSGKVRLKDQTLELVEGNFTLQTLSSGIARGNFSARVKGQTPPWEVVGSFEAPCGL